MIGSIIDSINTTLESCLAIEGAIYYGVAEFIEVNKEKYPFTIINGEKVKICLSDNVPAMFYHRIEKASFKDNEGLSFGKKTTKDQDYNVKLIVALRDSLIDVSPEFVSEEIAIKIPEFIENPNYKLITTEINFVTLDHDGIVNREWKGMDYSKHKCKFTVFEIDYTLTAIRCVPLCLNG
jgi:hypothetical protein